MSIYVRGSGIAVVWPGTLPQDLAGERWEKGGRPENDLMPIDSSEREMCRIVVPEHYPEQVVSGMSGRPLREVMTIPDWKGFTPEHGNDHASDAIHLMRDEPIAYARRVERGVLIAVQTQAVKKPWL